MFPRISLAKRLNLVGFRGYFRWVSAPCPTWWPSEACPTLRSAPWMNPAAAFACARSTWPGQRNIWGEDPGSETCGDIKSLEFCWEILDMVEKPWTWRFPVNLRVNQSNDTYIQYIRPKSLKVTLTGIMIMINIDSPMPLPLWGRMMNQ